MSVKNKVKRCNKEIKRLEDDLKKLRIQNETLINNLGRYTKNDIKILENLLKFAITNHIAGLRGGIEVDRYSIDKMSDLKLNIEYRAEFNSYLIKVNY